MGENNRYYAEYDPFTAMHERQLQQEQMNWLQQHGNAASQPQASNTQADFAHLQGAANQFAPQPHHGPGLGTLAALGAVGYFAGQARQEMKQHPVDRELKATDTWIPWSIAAAILHFALFLLWYGSAANGDQYFWLGAFLIGCAVWVPTWVIVFAHRRHNQKYNRSVLARRKAAE